MALFLNTYEGQRKVRGNTPNMGKCCLCKWQISDDTELFFFFSQGSQAHVDAHMGTLMRVRADLRILITYIAKTVKENLGFGYQTD